MKYNKKTSWYNNFPRYTLTLHCSLVVVDEIVIRFMGNLRASTFLLKAINYNDCRLQWEIVKLELIFNFLSRQLFVKVIKADCKTEIDSPSGNFSISK